MASSPKNVPCPVSHLGCQFVSSSVEDSVRHYKEECKFSLVLCSQCGTQVDLFPSLYFLKQWCSCKATSPFQDQQDSSKSVLEQLQSVQEEQRSFREWMKEWTAGLETRLMKTIEERVNTKLDALTGRMEDVSKDGKLVMRKLGHMDDNLQDTNAAHEFLLAQLRADVRASKNKQDYVLVQVDQASKVTLQELKDSKELSLRNVEEFARDKFDLLSNKVDEVKEEISRMTNAATLTELDSVVKTSNAALQNLLAKLSTDFLAVKETLEDNVRKIAHVSETASCASQRVEDLAKEVLELKKDVEEVKKLASEIPGIKECLESVNVFMREVPALENACVTGINKLAEEVSVLGRKVEDVRKAEEAKEWSKAVSVVSGRRSWMGRVGTWAQGSTVFWYIEGISELFRKGESISSRVQSGKFSIVNCPCEVSFSLSIEAGAIRMLIRVIFSYSKPGHWAVFHSLPCTVSLVHPEGASKNENVRAELLRNTDGLFFPDGVRVLGGKTTLCTVDVRRKGFIMHDAICVAFELFPGRFSVR